MLLTGHPGVSHAALMFTSNIDTAVSRRALEKRKEANPVDQCKVIAVKVYCPAAATGRIEVHLMRIQSSFVLIRMTSSLLFLVSAWPVAFFLPTG